ncbi:MAG: hypothetical protein R3B99_35880 [Polyangiales bacterium]|nr:hypothetical protein [Myxococcales bacterium]MCB9601268.1 hypothetical protein [Sandaracinus sp.]
MIADDRLIARCPCGRSLPPELAWLGDLHCGCGRSFLSVGWGFLPYDSGFFVAWGDRYPRAIHRAVHLVGGRFLPPAHVEAFGKVLDPYLAPDATRKEAVGRLLGAVTQLPRAEGEAFMVAAAAEVAIDRVVDRLRRVRQAAPAGVARALFADATTAGPESLRAIEGALVGAEGELEHRRQLLRLRRASAEVRALEVAEEHQPTRILGEVAIEFCVVENDLLDRQLLEHFARACGGDRRRLHDRLAAVALSVEDLPRWRAFDHGTRASDEGLVLPLLQVLARQLVRDRDASHDIGEDDSDAFDAYRTRLLEVASASVASRRLALTALLVELVHTNDEQVAQTRVGVLDRLVAEVRHTHAVDVSTPLSRELAARFKLASEAS